MSSKADKQLLPRTLSLNYAHGDSGSLLVHLSATFKWKQLTDKSFYSSKFPIGWKEQWIFQLSSGNLTVHAARGGRRENAHFIVKGRTTSRYVYTYSYQATNPPLNYYSLDSICAEFSQITMGILILNAEDFTFLDKHISVSIRNIFKEQLANGFSPDVTLIANDGQFIWAHRELLTARFPAFLAMQSQDFQERKTNEIKLELDFECLKTLLLFVYTGQMDIESIEMAKSLLKAGHMYQMDEVKTAAEIFLINSVDFDNAFDFLQYAKKNNVPLVWQQAARALKGRKFEPPED